jgi:hypothetical protein
MTTVYPYAYSPIVPTFNGKVENVKLRNNPYSSYNTGPTGSSATLYLYKNGSQVASSTRTYAPGSAGQVLTFNFSSNNTFTSSDRIEFRFQSNGIWRYTSWGIELIEQ